VSWAYIKRLREVPDPTWLRALLWALTLGATALAVLTYDSGIVWLVLLAFAVVGAVVQFWLRSQRLKRMD
jgi:hypothetical protein